MATSKVKKVTVPKNSLPPVGPNNNYLIRYRIVSEDKNRTSHWSQIYSLPATGVSRVEGGLSVNNDVVIVTWNKASGSGNKEAYDLFINIDNAGWQLQESPKTRSVIFTKPTIVSTLDVVVQVESYLKVYNEDLVIFEETFMV